MRYLESDQVVFIDKAGKRFEMLDFQDVPETEGKEMQLNVDRDLDSLAYKIYGQEPFWHKLYDANRETMVENNNSLEGINKIIVPE